MPQAYLYMDYGGPEVERLVDQPRPVPGAGQVLVAVRAAGVNPVDWKRRAGFMRAIAPDEPVPGGFGSEISGVVAELGPDVTDFAAGDEVFGNPVGNGGYAEYALLTAATAARKPAGLSFVDAATLPVAAATAYDGIRQLDLPAGATLLVTGAGGGVGVAAVQLARHEGLHVIGTASAAKHDLVESLGATHVAYGDGLDERLRAAAPDGVDAVFDLVGGPALEAAAALVADKAKLITAADRQTVARLGGEPVQRLRTRAVLDAIAALAVAGVLDPKVTATYPLDRAGEALRAVESGHATGKVVIEVH